MSDLQLVEHPTHYRFSFLLFFLVSFFLLSPCLFRPPVWRSFVCASVRYGRVCVSASPAGLDALAWSHSVLVLLAGGDGFLQPTVIYIYLHLSTFIYIYLQYSIQQGMSYYNLHHTLMDYRA